MSATRLQVEPASLRAGEIVVDGDDHHYLTRVRRMRPGDRLTLFDGAGGEAEAELLRIDAVTAVLRAEEPRRLATVATRLRVGVGLIKGERMDWCVQKLVEVGVDEIVLMPTARAVVRLDEARARSRLLRLEGVARDAARQSRRAAVPALAVAAGFAAAMAQLADSEVRLLAHPQAGDGDLRDALPAAGAGVPASAALLIGPEGGFAGDEIEAALAAGWTLVGLGPTILRAETAAIVGAALLRFALA